MPKPYTFTRALREKCGLPEAEAARVSELCRRACLLALADEGTCDIEGIVRLSARARRQATMSDALDGLLDHQKDPARVQRAADARSMIGKSNKKG